MTWKERLVIEEAYTKKLVAHLQGKDLSDYSSSPLRRSTPYSQRNTETLEALKSQNVQPDAERGITVYQDRQER